MALVLNAGGADPRIQGARFAGVPPIEPVLVNRKDLPSAGAGETAIRAVAPGIGDAGFAAIGVRLRSMPVAPDGRVARA